jgi:SAM-dependent methyltransferase
MYGVEGLMLREWVTLLRLARRRFRSEDDYYAFQKYQGDLIKAYLEENAVELPGVRILDLGCGKGGYSEIFADVGAEVVSVDIGTPLMASFTFVQANALRLPFPESAFSFIFCASLIEHVPQPLQLLKGIRRLLSADGSAYVSFPPFYSPVGGHQFKPYHLLGERLALRLSGAEVEGYANACGNWGLYPLTIHRARKLIAEAGLCIVDEATRFLPFNVAQLPWIGEFLTWHVQFILRK